MTLWRFLGLWLALDAFLIGIWCLCIIAQTTRQARDDSESDDAELADFFIVPEAINSIHDGDK